MNTYSHINIMQKKELELQKYLKIISDKSKYKIIKHLAGGEDCVCNIVRKLKLERTLISHHLNILQKANLIKGRKSGTWIYYSLEKKTFESIEELFKELLGSANIRGKPNRLDKNNKCN
ncbi:MAG: metalloregulator ArsR/SmtB family transcription factor [Patescibacteria group bacterium]|nr:metalloregulator ArsR/SmtB family transcription factor [Patescibacteria group bacterium]